MMALVALSPELCPDCGADLAMYQVDQPALFKHGGYGATERTVLVMCAGCGYGRQRERSEVSPRDPLDPALWPFCEQRARDAAAESAYPKTKGLKH